MNPVDFFLSPGSIPHKQYEALRMYFVEEKTAAEVAVKFGYTYRGFTTVVSNFRKELKINPSSDIFFLKSKKGRKVTSTVLKVKDTVIEMRKKNCSVEDIKTYLDSKNLKVSQKTIYNILTAEGFSRLPRREKSEKKLHPPDVIKAEKSVPLEFKKEEFKSSAAGILSFLPYLQKFGITDIIEKSGYPETTQINKLSSILSFIALKASNIRRYSADNLWCMDRGMGLFAGLNVLPKAAWFSSYSNRITPSMNTKFLKALHSKWVEEGLIKDTMNLDFTTVPYWGDDQHLENNWSGKRGKALSSMLAVLAHDPDTGIIDYGNADVKHDGQNDVVLEFLDFYHSDPKNDVNLKYLVFDSKFTTYENLGRINKKGIKFVTIRRRGKNIINKIDNIPEKSWKKIRVEAAGNKKRTVKAYEEHIFLDGYGDIIRQIVITGHGKIKPAIIITNDFDLSLEEIVRKYTRRWIVEKAISEQISFFHLNNVSSSMVIKVDFDLTISILTHNIYRLFARDLERYSNLADQSIFEKFINNSADIRIGEDAVSVSFKKKRNLPLLLEKLSRFNQTTIPLLKNKSLVFSGASYS